MSDFNRHRNMSTDFIKTVKYKISRKFFMWQSLHSMWTDRRTDMARLTVTFRNCFKNAPNKGVTFRNIYVQFCAKYFESEL